MTEMSQCIRWHQCTGYYPIKKGAFDILEREGWFERHPHFKTALSQLNETIPGRATQGAVVGGYRAIHDIIIEIYEAIMKGQPVKEALADASKKAEEAIEDYRSVVE
jgi:sn-glycerol 3-phosphate transport system substrate-binding protein